MKRKKLSAFAHATIEAQKILGGNCSHEEEPSLIDYKNPSLMKVIGPRPPCPRPR